MAQKQNTRQAEGILKLVPDSVRTTIWIFSNSCLLGVLLTCSLFGKFDFQITQGRRDKHIDHMSVLCLTFDLTWWLVYPIWFSKLTAHMSYSS